MEIKVNEEKKLSMIESGKHPSIKNIKIRTTTGKIKEVKNVNKKIAIKLMCTECMGYVTHPNECTSIYCPLYNFRGKSRLGNS